jgi:hypothetical protein
VIDLKKKFIVGILTAISYGLAQALKAPEMADGFLKIGLTVIGALGLEDFGKAASKTK